MYPGAEEGGNFYLVYLELRVVVLQSSKIFSSAVGKKDESVAGGWRLGAGKELQV